MSKKSSPLPFDKAGGVITYPKRILNSEAYSSLGLYAKVLIPLLQAQWRNNKPVDYGVREAQEKIPCAFGTAREAFIQLQDRGFIVLAEPSVFSSTRGSKARSWRLTWLPFNGADPTKEWEAWRPE